MGSDFLWGTYSVGEIEEKYICKNFISNLINKTHYYEKNSKTSCRSYV
jgi:hypothetical protein